MSDEYPSKFAMEAAVRIEIQVALGGVKTIVYARILDEAIAKALKAHGVDVALAATSG